MPLNTSLNHRPVPLAVVRDDGRRDGDNTKALRAAATFDKVCPVCRRVWAAHHVPSRGRGNAYCVPCSRARSLAYMGARRLRLAALRKAARDAD